MRTLAQKTAIALGTVAVVAAAAWMWRAVLLLLLSLTLAASAESAVQWLCRRRLPRGAAIALVYGLGLLLAVSSLCLAFAELPGELARALSALQRAYDQLRVSWPTRGPLLRALAERLPDPSRLYDGDALEQLSGGALALARRALTLLVGLLAAIVLSLFWALSAQPFERLWLSLLPMAHRARGRQVWQALREGVGRELRASLVQGALMALLSSLVFRALGLPYPILSALLVGALRFVPLVGPLLVPAVAFLAGLSRGLPFALALLLLSALLLLAVRLLVAERLLGARRLPPLLVVAVLLALWDGGGFFLLLAGAPLAAALTVLREELLSPSLASQPHGPLRAHRRHPSQQQAIPAPRNDQRLHAAAEPRVSDLARLTQRFDELQDLLRELPSPRPKLANVASRLGALLHEAAAVVEGEAPLDPRREIRDAAARR